MEPRGYEVLKDPYDPYDNPIALIAGLIFRYLKNVRFYFLSYQQIILVLTQALGNKRMANIYDEHTLAEYATRFGNVDMATLIFQIFPHGPRLFHVSPIIWKTAFLIVSTVRSDARKKSSETLSFQGLSTLVWILVGFSVLVVSGLATHFSFKTEKNRREKPLTSWMKSAFVYAADILNNCVAGVVRSGPGRQVRACWLLGVVFLMQFWIAGMKSDLLLDQTSFIDSLEDLLAMPELVCLVSTNFEHEYPFGLKEDDPRYEDYKKMSRYVIEEEDELPLSLLSSGEGIFIVQEISLGRYARMKLGNRKLYFGKERYNERYSHMQFNKRIPRAIKEDIDYLLSRITETRQIEPRLRLERIQSRGAVIDTNENSDGMSWSPNSFEFMSPVFRLWIIGMSLATIAFCVEFYLRRSPVKISPYHSLGIWIRA